MKSFGSRLAGDHRGELVTLSVLGVVGILSLCGVSIAFVTLDEFNVWDDNHNERPTGLDDVNTVPEIVIIDDSGNTTYVPGNSNSNGNENANSTTYTTSHSVTYTYNYSYEDQYIKLQEKPDWDMDEYSPIGEMQVGAYQAEQPDWALFFLIFFGVTAGLIYGYNRYFAKPTSRRFF